MDKHECCELNSDDKGLYFKCAKEVSCDTECTKKESSWKFFILYGIAQAVAAIIGWEIGNFIFKSGF